MWSDLKKVFRKSVSPVAGRFYSMLQKIKSEGQFKTGISAVVVARDESYNLPLALESLIGFADEIICIDNGSHDNSLQTMKTFGKQFGRLAEIKIFEAPGKLLGECRNMGLQNSTRQWHLRWDADMVFRQKTGHFNSAMLKEEIKNIRKPTAIKLKRINLGGDFHHVSALHPVVDAGEYFLVWRTGSLCYTEHKKFDILKIPFYYSMKEFNEPCIFHLNELKSLSRILYRQEYFNWRQSVLSGKETGEFDTFRRQWRQKMFGAESDLPVLYRFQKKYLVLNSAPFDLKKYGPYPEKILEAIENKNERFSYRFADGKAIARIDCAENLLENYIPTDEDLKWNVYEHLKQRLSPTQKKIIGLE